MEKLKICFVLEYYYPHIGGGEIYFQSLAEGLAAKGIQCSVVTSALKGTPFFEVINGVQVFRVPVPGIFDRYFFMVFSIWRALIVARDCDIIHARTYTAIIPAWIASRLLRKKSILTVFEVVGEKWEQIPDVGLIKGALAHFFERLILKFRFNRYHSISEYTFRSLEKVGIAKEKISLIYPGLDVLKNTADHISESIKSLKNTLGMKNKDFLYLYYGRPGPTKGLEYLIRAVPLISSSIPGSKLLLILTKDPLKRFMKIKAIIDSVDLNEDIVLMPSVDRVRLFEIISSVDCVVIPSLSEGFGLSAAEACLLGVPVVATETGALPEVLWGKVVFVPPAMPDAIAKACLRVYNKKINPIPVKNFSRERCLEENIVLYERLLKEGCDEG